MSLKFMSFDFDEERGWSIRAEGVYPGDLNTLIHKILAFGKAQFPHLRQENKVQREKQPLPAEQPVSRESNGAEYDLCAVAPDGGIFVLEKSAGTKTFEIHRVLSDRSLAVCRDDDEDAADMNYPKFASTLSKARATSVFRKWGEYRGFEVKEHSA